MKPLIILSGPTAVGKTDLSLKLAKRVNGEIVSADSMQVYRGMDIGTAKIMPDEMQNVRHHLIDILSPFEEWNVLKFQTLAKEAIEKIYQEGHIPIITGGTGFYIQALIKNVDFTEEKDSSVRLELEERYRREGADGLYEELQKTDPESARIIHKNNVKRVIRAIEFYRLNGYPISEHNAAQSGNESPYNYAYFVLTDERERLYSRIDMRVDKMMEAGLVEEVKRLRDSGLDRTYVSMQGLGYKEILDYLEAKTSLEEAVYILKRDTRHFAKRQLTWFRREKNVVMLNKGDFRQESDILDYMTEYLNTHSVTALLPVKSGAT